MSFLTRLSRLSLRYTSPKALHKINMPSFSSNSPTPLPPAFKPFKLALIQLGQVGNDKSANLSHARDMIRKAASGGGDAAKKPDLIVLPVSTVTGSVAFLEGRF